MALEVSVDPELCIGSGDCVRLLPGAFQIDESLGVSVPRPGAGRSDATLLQRARRGCPTHAIELIDANGAAIPDRPSDR